MRPVWTSFWHQRQGEKGQTKPHWHFFLWQQECFGFREALLRPSSNPISSPNSIFPGWPVWWRARNMFCRERPVQAESQKDFRWRKKPERTSFVCRWLFSRIPGFGDLRSNQTISNNEFYQFPPGQNISMIRETSPREWISWKQILMKQAPFQNVSDKYGSVHSHTLEYPRTVQTPWTDGYCMTYCQEVWHSLAHPNKNPAALISSSLQPGFLFPLVMSSS